MKRLLLVILLLGLAAPALAQYYPGTNLRGKIVTYAPYYNTYVPLQFAVVALYSQNPYTGEWNLVAETETNVYGFYFFYGVTPGGYYLQVNGLKNYQINVVWINYNRFTFQDLPLLYF